MKYRLLPIAVLALSVLGPGTRTHAANMPEMSCHDIGGFARVVVQQKRNGIDLEEALDGLEDSLGPEFTDMKRDLGFIVRTIYTQKQMSAAGPDEVGAAFEKACDRFKGHRR